MPSPYPIEIRTRVIEKVEGGMKIIEVILNFRNNETNRRYYK